MTGSKTERSQTSELQPSLGDVFDAEKQLQKRLDPAVTQPMAAQADNGTPPTNGFGTLCLPIAHPLQQRANPRRRP